MTSRRREVLGLYRRIIRESRRLEPDEREHYRRFARSNYIGHSDEIETDRIDEIIARAESDMDWILRKYTNEGLSEKTDYKHQLK